MFSFRKQLDTVTNGLHVAQVRTIQANNDRSSLQHQISFIHKFITVDQQRAISYEQELERSKLDLHTLRNQVDSKRQEVQQSKNEMKRQLNHLHTLKKELENGLTARIALEIELQTLREQLAFERAVNEEECNEWTVFGTFQIDASQFYRDELARAIASIKKDFDVLSRMRHQELEGKKKYSNSLKQEQSTLQFQ